MKHTVRIAVVGLALVAVAAGGCKARPTAPRPGIELRPAFALMETTPADAPLRADDLAALEPGSRQYVIVDDEGFVESSMTITRQPTDQHDAAIAVQEGDERTIYIRADDQGNIVMTAALEPADNALTLFQPPQVIAFAELQPGESRTSESAMRVVDPENPSRVRESGRGTRTITYVGDQRIATPSGQVVAKRMESRFNADLRMADAEDFTILFIVPGAGIVAEQSSEQVKALGLFGRSTQRTIVLSETPPIATSVEESVD